ncbi:MAG: nitroreductase family protein [Bacteroidota bacterium]
MESEKIHQSIQALKQADTAHDIHPLLKKRWSPRAFADRDIPQEILNELFEAARWAASSMNEQPWQYVYARKGTQAFDEIIQRVMPGNQVWAKEAPVILVALKRSTFERNGKPNPGANHDLGMANAQLVLQAAHRDIYVHMMGGFFRDQMNDYLQLEENVGSAVVMALGYMGEVDQLEEPYKSRETTPRTRKPISAFVKALN